MFYNQDWDWAWSCDNSKRIKRVWDWTKPASKKSFLSCEYNILLQYHSLRQFRWKIHRVKSTTDYFHILQSTMKLKTISFSDNTRIIKPPHHYHDHPFFNKNNNGPDRTQNRIYVGRWGRNIQRMGSRLQNN